MIRPFLGILAFLAAVGCGSREAPKQAAQHDSSCALQDAEGVQVTDAWIRAAADGQQATAAYFTLCKAGDEPDRLVGVETAIASAVELHETMKDANDVASMSPVESLELLPNAAVPLAPGAKHVMLIGLNQSLADGAIATLTLKFEHSPPITIDVPVRAARPQDEGH